MTSLDEIKSAIVGRIDAAWTEIEHEVDADRVRTYVQGLTGELLSHVYAVEAALVNHVLGKQDPTPAPAEPSAGTGDMAPAPVETAQAAPADAVQEQPTGMAANAPADTTADVPAEPSTPEPTQ